MQVLAVTACERLGGLEDVVAVGIGLKLGERGSVCSLTCVSPVVTSQTNEVAWRHQRPFSLSAGSASVSV